MPKDLASKFLYQLLTVILGAGIGLLATAFLGHNPLEVILILIRFLVRKESFNWILVSFAPILLCALSFLLTFKSGVNNFGTAGQYAVGAISAAIWGLSIDTLPPLNITMALLAGAVGGGLWALPPAILKWKRNINEIVTTLLLAFLAPVFGLYMAKLPWFNDPTHTNFITTLPVKPSARLPVIIPGTEINAGLLIAIACAFILYLFLWKTRTGLRIRATGMHAAKARFVGISTEKLMNSAFILSGALAGLGGACYVLGVAHTYHSTTFMGLSGYGFTGLIAAFIGGMHPIGVIFSSFFFSVLSVGGLMLNIGAAIPVDYVVFIQGLILTFVAVPTLTKKMLGRMGK